MAMKKVSKKNVLRPSNMMWPEEWSIEEVGMTQSLWSDWCTNGRVSDSL